MTDNAIYLGSESSAPSHELFLLLQFANRHGLIAGATGTGKTVTLQVLAEGFSNAGVPVFMADVKGDLSGMCQPSAMQDFLVKRAEEIGMSSYAPSAQPCVFWDLFGEKGHPMRTTISEMGPVLLARILELNDTQEGVLNIAFRIADEEGLLLLDLKDLRALLVHMGERAKELSLEYGNVSTASIGAIQRGLLRLEEQGAEHFFGEPALELPDLMRTDLSGKGIISILAADKLMQTPRLYAAFLLWLLSELFEDLPEAGDLKQPKLVFFFDEAHLLFNDAPKSLLEKVEQVVRLIRSKGVGIYFVTQNPQDIPESVLSQLGNRVQHALRAFTPQQQKFIDHAAQTYRPNPKFKVADVITNLGTGEALVSVLEEKGNPGMVERLLIRPPSSLLGPAASDIKQKIMAASPVCGKYDAPQDRDSAYEMLKLRAAEKAVPSQPQGPAQKPSASRAPNRQSVADAAVKSVVRAMGSSLGRSLMNALVRGLLGTLKR